MVQSTNDETGVSPATSPYPLITYAVTAGGESFKPCGVIDELHTAVGTDAATTEKVLWSKTLAAGTLYADGVSLVVDAAGIFAANANTKTLKFYTGASNGIALNDATTAPNNARWVTRIIVKRTSATQILRTRVTTVGGTVQTVGVVGIVIDPTATILLQFTGTNGTASANDISLNSVEVTIRPYG